MSSHGRSPDVKGRAHPGFNIFNASLLTASSFRVSLLDKHTRFRLSYWFLCAHDQGQRIPDQASFDLLGSAVAMTAELGLRRCWLLRRIHDWELTLSSIQDNRIRSLCVREYIPVITVAPELQAYAEKSCSFLYGFGSDLGSGH